MFNNNSREKEPAYYLSVLNNEVKNYNVYVMGALERMGTLLVLFILGAAVSYIFYGGLFKLDGMPTFATYVSNTVVCTVGGMVAAAVFFPVRVKQQIKNQKGKLRNQFRDFLESFVASLSAGKNVTNAIVDTRSDLTVQYGAGTFMVNELAEIEAGLQNNVRMEVLMKNLGERSQNQDIIDFASVFEIAFQKGADVRTVAQKTFTVINEKMEISSEIETKLTSNKMQLYVMTGMPVFLVAMLRFSNASFASNFATPSGIASVTVGILTMIIAFFIGNKMLDV